MSSFENMKCLFYENRGQVCAHQEGPQLIGKSRAYGAAFVSLSFVIFRVFICCLIN